MRPQIIAPDKTRAALDDLRATLERRCAVSSHMLCPIEFTSALLGMCAAESCGKCTPCRVGLSQLKSLIDNVLDGTADIKTIDLIARTARNIYLSADCAIGYGAAQMAMEAVSAFRDDFEHHVQLGCCGLSRESAIPCTAQCPAGVDIPGYLALVRAKRYTDAVRLIRKDNPLTVVCGLVCEHPCELACRRSMVDDPLNIRGIKRYAAEHMEADYRPEIAPSTGKNIAVVGGGPAGLSVAYYLALMGHTPTIFEQRQALGGMLRYGIPAYRLPRERLDQEIQWLLDCGVRATCDVSIGQDITLDDLRRDFDAVYLAIGAHSDRKLNIDGEDAEGVISAVEMLRRMGENDQWDFFGQDIVVVGGGNVAMDVARTAVRLGARRVTIVYRRRMIDMTAQPEEITGAIEEGCVLMELSAPLRVETKEGKVAGLRVKPQIVGALDSRRPQVSDADAAEIVLPCDKVLVAVGQGIDSRVLDASGISVARGRIVTTNDVEIPGLSGLFAGGDCVSGPATVIRAVAAGKEAAVAIDAYLGFDHQIIEEIDIPLEQGATLPSCARSNMVERDALTRGNDFALIEEGLTEEEAIQEASRCLRCDRFGFAAFRGGRVASCQK